jgi:hypothetical protein
LLIHGKGDRLVLPSVNEHIYPKITGSRLEVVAGGSSMLSITHAAQPVDWVSPLQP